MIPDTRSRQALLQYTLNNSRVSDTIECNPELYLRRQTPPKTGDHLSTTARYVAVWLNEEKCLPAETNLGDLANGAKLNLPNENRCNLHPSGYSYVGGRAQVSHHFVLDMKGIRLAAFSVLRLGPLLAVREASNHRTARRPRIILRNAIVRCVQLLNQLGHKDVDIDIALSCRKVVYQGQFRRSGQRCQPVQTWKLCGAYAVSRG